MPTRNPADRDPRRRRIIEAGSLQGLLDSPDGRAVLEAEASDPALDPAERIITREQLDHLLLLRTEQARAGASLALGRSSEDVLIVPGFMGSTLTDTARPYGLIWIDPGLVIDGGLLSALRLQDFVRDVPERDQDARVRVEVSGTIPAVYDLMRADLSLFCGYSVDVFPYDWRKDLERSANRLADLIRVRASHTPRPLHLVAHSQGTLVARRAIQLVGASMARRLFKSLVLLGPATFGTFSAAFALAGTSDMLGMLRKFDVKVPADFDRVVRSFTGLYQLLPWSKAAFPDTYNPEAMKDATFWKRGVDPARLAYGFA